MNSAPSRPIDITFVGTLSTATTLESSYLVELAKVLGALTTPLQVSFVVDGVSPSEIPAELSKYIKTAPASLSAHFESSRVALLFDSTSSTQGDLLKTAVNAGAYVIIDEPFAAKNRWLSPCTFASVKSINDILSAITEYFASPLIDMFLSVSLASRGQLLAAIKKCEDVKVYFPSVEGVEQFHRMQVERLKSSS